MTTTKKKKFIASNGRRLPRSILGRVLSGGLITSGVLNTLFDKLCEETGAGKLRFKLYNTYFFSQLHGGVKNPHTSENYNYKKVAR